ncbi:MAG TPA: efflux RND transporter periplasmic adaptor subunit, partial [Novosphingobium sp.]|nr:efflux RND transporter periplasmic adaptor subunit [Novosphingobium sp.]
MAGHGWVWAAGLAGLAALGGALAWAWRPLPVEVARPTRGPAADLVYATGYVEAAEPVLVVARLTAPVLKVLVAEGQAVRKGQPLAILDAGEQRALAAQTAAQERAATLAEGRSLALFGDGWVTKAARDAAVADADAARAAHAAAAARIDQLVVRAGIDGIVTKRDIYPGELASPSRTLFQLGDPARQRITATLDERDIARIAPGQPALMSSDAWPGRVLHAHVAEITPGGDPTTRAFRVRLQADEHTVLPMGLTLEVNIIARQHPHALLLPASAVSGGRVWVVAQGRARPRAITTGIAGADRVEITGGLG